MNVDMGRIRGVVLKELREYRRSPFIVGTMAVSRSSFSSSRSSSSSGSEPHPRWAVDKSVSATFLLLLITPVLIPAVLAAYSVVGEREQGTLEPLLTTPVRREELLLGKALGVVVPTVAIAYLVFASSS